MKKTTTLAASLTILVLFVISLLPWTFVQPAEKGELRAAIVEIQNLQKSASSAASDLRLDFVNTISALRAAAGINTMVTGKTDAADSASPKITVCVRIPYLLPDSTAIHSIGGGRKLAPSAFYSHYQSITPSPDTRPPLFS